MGAGQRLQRHEQIPRCRHMSLLALHLSDATPSGFTSVSRRVHPLELQCLSVEAGATQIERKLDWELEDRVGA